MPSLDSGEAWRRLREARVARMATADVSGVPHAVPFVFAVRGRTVYWVVDAKPKRSRRLKRLENIAANPHVEIVVDHYEEDWSRLWWVRASGTARVVDGAQERDAALALLAERYESYGAAAPGGPVVAIDVVRIGGWSASGPDAPGPGAP